MSNKSWCWPLSGSLIPKLDCRELAFYDALHVNDSAGKERGRVRLIRPFVSRAPDQAGLRPQTRP